MKDSDAVFPENECSPKLLKISCKTKFLGKLQWWTLLSVSAVLSIFCKNNEGLASYTCKK